MVNIFLLPEMRADFLLNLLESIKEKKDQILMMFALTVVEEDTGKMNVQRQIIEIEILEDALSHHPQAEIVERKSHINPPRRAVEEEEEVPLILAAPAVDQDPTLHLDQDLPEEKIKKNQAEKIVPALEILDQNLAPALQAKDHPQSRRTILKIGQRMMQIQKIIENTLNLQTKYHQPVQ